MVEKRINADCRYRAAAHRTSPDESVTSALQPSRTFSLPYLSLSIPSLPFRLLPSSEFSLPLSVFVPLSLSKLIRPRESRDRRKSSRKFDCTRFATRALFYIRRYMSIGKSRGTEAIVTNNAKIASDAAFCDIVNWFALNKNCSVIVNGKLYSFSALSAYHMIYQ